MIKEISLGEKLKQARLRKKYTQKYVYEHFGIKQSTFSSWERGIANPDHSMFFKLCEFYGIQNINDFLQTEDIEKFLEHEQNISNKSNGKINNDTKDYKSIIDNQITEHEQKLI